MAHSDELCLTHAAEVAVRRFSKSYFSAETQLSAAAKTPMPQALLVWMSSYLIQNDAVIEIDTLATCYLDKLAKKYSQQSFKRAENFTNILANFLNKFVTNNF